VPLPCLPAVGARSALQHALIGFRRVFRRNERRSLSGSG